MADLTIASRGNVRLEARWDSSSDPGHVMVFCHPHPEHGGTMNVPLLVGVTDTLVAAGIGVDNIRAYDNNIVIRKITRQ